VQSLVPETYKGPFVTESVAHLQNIGELPTLDTVKESAVWDVLARLGWYREFVRLVSRFVEYDLFFLADISPHAARKANREFRGGNDRS
jgi:hypothetical protein